MAQQALFEGCIDGRVKKVLLDTIKLQCESMPPTDVGEKKFCFQLPPLLESAPECPVISGITGMVDPSQIKRVGYDDEDDDETPVAKKGKKGKKKRKLSDYNKHISVCMKEDKTRTMTDCVKLWKEGDKMHERYTEDAQEAEEA